MSRVVIAGAGAFGTALAIALGQDRPIILFSHRRVHADEMQALRENRARLAGFTLPPSVTVTAEMPGIVQDDIVLLCMPMQSLGASLGRYRDQLGGATLVACCKGVDRARRLGPSGLISAICPEARAAVLTGPSFARDIAAGLPTALTLAVASGGEDLQQALATATLRPYLTDDLIGAELGGALKNVIALVSGLAIGAGYGESARASIVTRGFAEMTRFAMAQGARSETLSGLSGLGDLLLTATSEKSRNYAAGLALGRGTGPSPGTIEGLETARAVAALAIERGIDMPLTQILARLLDQEITIEMAAESLLARPLRKE